MGVFTSKVSPQNSPARLRLRLSTFLRRIFGQDSNASIAEKPTLNACGFSHQYVLISAQPVPAGVSPIPHTIGLYRCKRCSGHTTTLFAGDWQFADFHLAEMEQLERDAKRAGN